jgi:uncharacterized protein YdeI (YjbR/CyaY-like superfamily)
MALPQPVFFSTPDELRAWLEIHHGTAAELWVGYYRKRTGRPSLTWQQSVDEALCFGWIDGIRKRIDEERYTNRFTPRRRGSVWSAINIARVQVLIDEGRMRPAGEAAFAARDPATSQRHLLDERRAPRLRPAETARFRARRRAWTFFESQPPGYRRLATWWVVSAKRDETRARRLARLIEDSAAGRRIGPTQPGKRR